MIDREDYYEFHESRIDLKMGLVEVVSCTGCGNPIHHRNASKEPDICRECFAGRVNEDGGDR